MFKKKEEKIEVYFVPITIELTKVYDELAVIRVNKDGHDTYVTLRIGDKLDLYKEVVKIGDR